MPIRSSIFCTLRAVFCCVLGMGMAALASADCIPYTDAHKYIGETRCVTGKVLRVKQGNRGVHFFDFCEDYRTCSFTVVVFPSDLKRIGDIRQLQGREIEIHGPVKEYDGRAEIVLSQARQLGRDAAKIPPLPKDYDVEKKGRFSAGKYSHSKGSRKPAHAKSTLPGQIEEPSEAAGPEQ